MVEVYSTPFVLLVLLFPALALGETMDELVGREDVYYKKFAEICARPGGVVQKTYNTQNLASSGCYESTDSGLSDLCHQVVAEMNRVGMLCDLSHVGSVTSRNVIETSQKPVAYTHCLPTGLKDHPPYKTDGDLRFIANHCGFIGVIMFTPFLKRGGDSTVDDYIEGHCQSKTA